MDSPCWQYGIDVPSRMCCISCKPYQEESVMNTTTVGVDLAKSCFQLAIADSEYRMQSRRRLSRG